MSRRAAAQLKQGLQVSRFVNVERDPFIVDDQTFNTGARRFLAVQGQRVRPEARREEGRRRAQKGVGPQALVGTGQADVSSGRNVGEQRVDFLDCDQGEIG